MQPLIDFFGADGFIPHGYCLTWSSGLLWLHVVSDALIVLSYYSIPLTLAYFIRQRKDLPYPWLFAMFGLFIVACGATHLLSVITVWIPLYWLDGIVKAVTAAVSVAAALMMFRVVPRALMLRSPAQLEVEVQEGKKAQKALQAILDNAPVGIWLVGVDKRYHFVNKTFCDAVGIAENQFLAATHLPDLLGAEMAANCMKSDQECLAKETPHISYEELTFVDGKQHLMEITKVKLRDSADVVTGSIGIAIDVTGRRKAEAELLLRAQLLDSVSDTIFLLDLDGKFVYLNEAAWKTRGYTRDEMMGINLHVLDTPKYEKLIADRFREITENGQCIFESEHRRKDGSVMPVEINARTIELGGHKRLLSIIRDITERRKAEGILTESEERYRALFEQGADSIWLLDAQTGVIVDFNTAAHESMGYTRGEFARLTIADLETTESPQEIALHMKRVRAQGSDIFETVHRTKRGELRHILVSVKAITFGGITYFQSIQRDITEHKEYEEELQRSNAELEQFSYAVSHDMRQPLRMISSYLQLLERSISAQLDNEKRGYFGFAIEGAKRIDQMLVALLEYSQIGRKGKSPTWISSRVALEEALQFLQPALDEAQARLSIAGEWPSILASNDEIARLLQNLIGNAIKYRIAGRTPEITITSEASRNEWRLCVADNGVGIIPDQINRLFHAFQRLQPRDAYEGTGIGLALCRKIAEHHKGRIWAESAGEGKGSKFCVVLPVLRGHKP